MRLLQLFDGANVNTCYRRKESVISQQALALYNSRIAWVRAQLVAQRLARDTAAADETGEGVHRRSVSSRACQAADSKGGRGVPAIPSSSSSPIEQSLGTVSVFG